MHDPARVQRYSISLRLCACPQLRRLISGTDEKMYPRLFFSARDGADAATPDPPAGVGARARQRQAFVCVCKCVCVCSKDFLSFCMCGQVILTKHTTTNERMNRRTNVFDFFHHCFCIVGYSTFLGRRWA